MEKAQVSKGDRLKAKGLAYKFKLGDIGKYSSTLKYKDINWKIKMSALGKKIPDIKERKKILMKGSAFNKLLSVLKNTDWAHTPVYHQFQRNDRWKHEDNSIYSETELKYNLSFLAKLLEGEKEMNDDDHEEVLAKYFKKTMHTIEVLMN